jgi:hypothetical protein
MGGEVYSDLTWERFVERSAEAYKSGVSEQDFGATLVGQRVRWQGFVESVDLKQKYVPGLSIKMPSLEVPLGDGRTLVGGGVFLRSGPRMPATVREKENVVFSGRFTARNVLSNVTFIVDKQASKVFVSLSLEDGEVLSK